MHASPTFSHLGITVPDIDAAVRWYQDVFEYRLLSGPIEVLEDGSDLARAAVGIFGPGFQRFRFAHLATGLDEGFEIFAFDAPPYERPENTFQFWRAGVHHFAVTVADVAGFAARVDAAGGRQRSEVFVTDPERGMSIVYCEDPWGNVFEACSHPYVEMWDAQSEG